MACISNALTCIPKSCGSNSGGIREIYVIDQDNIVSSATTLDTTAHTITSLTTVGGADFLQMVIRPNTGSMVVENPIDLINGSTSYAATVSLKFHKREATKSYSLQLLGESQRLLTFIIKDSNDIWWYLEDAQLNGGSETTGVLKADGSYYDITFLADLNHRPYAIEESIVAGLISSCVS